VLAPAAAVVLLTAPLTAASTSRTGVTLGLTTWALAAGTVCVNPIIYTFAGNQQGLTAGEGVSVVEIAQMPGGSVAAPALIGALSGLAGLRVALGSIAVAALLLAFLVGRVNRMVPRSAARGAPRQRRSAP
jgi:hypothetical protein